MNYVDLIGNDKFPCVHAIDAINHGRAKVVHYDYNKNYHNKLAKDIKTFLNALRNSSLNKSRTFIACFDDVNPFGRMEMAEFLLGVLSGLRVLDEKSWPNKKTANIYDENYEFYFNGKVIFPVLMCRNHDSEARRSSKTMIAFQPGAIFNYMKKIEYVRYSVMRKSTHNRLNKIFPDNPPFYLSEKSSGKNLVQYLGFDPEEIY